MDSQCSTSVRFMELAKQGQVYQNLLQTGPASGADAHTSTLHSIECMPVKERGGVYVAFQRRDVVQERCDRLLGNVWNEILNDDIWLTYPRGKHDAVEITSIDMESLQPGGFLSGNIIDFYIKYLWEKRCGMDRVLLHFFSSFFFTQLAENDGASTKSEQRKIAFKKVWKWTGELNIFEKACVLIPVNQSSHWSLIIISNLCSLASAPDKCEFPPCILHMDSVQGKHGNLEGHIRSYIIHAWKERYHDPNVDQLLALSQMKYEEVKVPQQDNDYDCGIYLLHFAELFLVEHIPALQFGFVPNQGSIFNTLWDASEVSAKRRDIRNLILELILSSKRKSRQHQIISSRLLRLMPVSQISEIYENCLDGNAGRIEDPQNNDLRRSNTGVDESELVDLQSTDEMVLGDQQPCQLLDPVLIPVKERRKRYRNWSKDETSILLDCKKEGGRFCKNMKQGTTDWIAISQEIEDKLGTTPSGDQCRLRYDTLLKAYKSSKEHCMKTGKKFSEELCQGELKLATNLTEDWYNAIDEICLSLVYIARSPKRVKYSPSVEDGAPVFMSPCNSPDRSSRIQNLSTLTAEASQGCESLQLGRVADLSNLFAQISTPTFLSKVPNNLFPVLDDVVLLDFDPP